jgi:hypothetical protein
MKGVWSNIEFSDQGLERVKKVQAFLNFLEEDKKKTGLEKSAFFELMASMLYLHDSYRTNKIDTFEKLKLAKGDKFGVSIIENIVEHYWHRIEAFSS